MASKVILSLSATQKPPSERSFQAPNKKRYKGIQTNEAPMKYLFDLDRSIRTVVCLVSPTAHKTALARFQAEMKKLCSLLEIQTIDVPDDGQIPDEAMAELLGCLEKGDKVYLDTSGGARGTVIGLLQLVRLLEYKGVFLQTAVYANLNSGIAPMLEDATRLYKTMDLISGAQQLADFGSVATLKAYFKGDTSEDGMRMKALLDAVDRMVDAITMCRLGPLEKAMTDYRTALTEADKVSSPVTRELTLIIKQVFASEVTTPWVIRWCLDHRMLPQALSIYREWMPKYLLRDSGLFTQVPALNERSATKKKLYQDDDLFLFDQFLNQTQPDEIDLPSWKYPIELLTDMGRHLKNSDFAVKDIRRTTAVCWDMLYVQTIRNMVLHSNETANVDKRLHQALTDQHYPTDYENLTAAQITGALRTALKRVETAR